MKKIVFAILALCLTAGAGLTAAGVMRANNSRQSFAADGYVLQGDMGELKQVGFAADTSYLISRSGLVTFDDVSGEKATVSRENFVHLSDGSIMALSDGILLDFNDLSDNFINNYYITAGLPITVSGSGSYYAETSAGSIEFGENIWKLSDQQYMVRASSITVNLPDDNIFEAEDFVQVSTEEDGIVRLLTQDGSWATISDESFLETAGGVRIYPVSQLVENGAYKLSVAKLAADPDADIVLTEAETRRQIVPELNIETIDGEDGADGEAGEAGQSGTAGEAGAEGVAGEAGEAGRAGENGAEGGAGAIGQTGTAGAAGTAGQAGASGSDGAKGRGGADGDGGNPGVSAAASSNKTALPTMTLTGWYPTSTRLSGTISIAEDGADLLNLSSTQYKDTVTIYNMDTGTSIPCYPVDAQTGNVVTDTQGYTDSDFYYTFSTTTGSVPFSTDGDTLTPDTNYRFSVVAYYKVDNEIYSREFISREFYTDPTGIILTASPATTGSVSLTAAVAPAYQGGALQSATVELLTANGTLVGSYTLNYTSNQITNAEGDLNDEQTHTAAVSEELSYNQALTFNNLPSNTAYTARVKVTTSSSTDTFDGYTKQVLPLTTLKKTPSVNKVDDVALKPTAFYNRASGVFEVTAPAITDTDGALVKYIYTAYTYDSANQKYVKCGSSRENSSGTVTFSLPSGTEYYFGVEMEAYDNEKQLYLDLGKTATSVIAYGSSLPRLSLTGTPTYNGYTSGVLTIALESGSSLTVDEAHTLTVQVYADQVLDQTFQLKGTGSEGAPETDGTNDSWYSAYYTSGSTTPQIHFTLSKLLKNTTYQMKLSGYLDLDDGNGAQFRTLGSVSFRTTNTSGLTASWTNNLQTSTTTPSKTFDQTVTLSFPASVTDSEQSYILPFLKAGQVSVTLYSGSGNTRRTMETITFQGDDVEHLLTSGTGLNLSDSNFTASVSADSRYTLEITEVRDNSMTMSGANGDYNTFDVSGATQNIVTLPKTPDLLMDPTQGIKATPIYNEDATKYRSYGASYNAALDDDAIIGYTLASNYDNSAYNGDSIIYYAFELSKFYTNAQNGLDLRSITTGDGATWSNYTVMEPMEREFTRGSSATPGVTVLFGEKPSSFTQGTNGVYYAGEANYNNGTLQGMGRGYCYVFAYMVKYRLTADDTSGTTYEYPYSSEQYESYKASRGAGELLASGTYVGLNQCYILNSGVMKAPKQEPDIRTYVYGETKNGESGVVTVHYHLFSDPDSVIGSGTNIVYNNENNLFIPSDGDARRVQGADTTDTVYDDWYSVSFSYAGNSAAGLTLEPTLDIYLYNVSDYASSPYYIDVNTGGDTAYTHYFCHIPVERDWASYIAEHVSIECNTEHLSENYIDFILRDNTAGGAYGGYAAELYSRAYSMSVTLTPASASGSPVIRSLSLTSGMLNGQTYYYGRFMTGSLDASYLSSGSQTFTLTASILYDNGRQGLQFMDDGTNRFALQYTNSTSAYDTFALGNWRTPSYSSSRPWNMLMSQNDTKLTTQTLRDKVTAEHSMTDAETFVISRLNWSSSSTSSLYLHPERWGVAMSSGSSASMSFLSALGEPGKQLFLTGKGYSTIGFNSADRWYNNNNSFTLTSITPTVQRSGTWYETTTETINVLNFNVINYTMANAVGNGDYTVSARLYDTEAHAKALGSDGLVATNPTNTWPVAWSLTNGAYSNPSASAVQAGTPQFQGLTSNTTYYLVLSMSIDSVDTILMDESTSAQAVYPIKTLSGVEITVGSQSLNYYNTSYFDKGLEMRYNLSSSINLSIKYDIYSNSECTELLAGHETLVAGGYATTVTPQLTDNQLNIKLPPGAVTNLLPNDNATYYLRITAWLNGSSSTTPAGTAVFPFKIPSVSGVDALIYAVDAGSNYITYQVTVNDPQYAVMGADLSGDGSVRSGLYAVRFTDLNDNWIETIYDDYLFSTGAARQQFKLSKDTVTGVTGSADFGQGTTGTEYYRLYIFAVEDTNYDGVVDSSFAPFNGKKWDELFYGLSATGTLIEKDKNDATLTPTVTGYKFDANATETFLTQLNGYWANTSTTIYGISGFNGHPLATFGTLPQYLELKEQQLPDSNGLLINASRAAISREGNTLSLLLQESFGIIVNGEQTFKSAYWQIRGTTSDGQSFSQNGTYTPDDSVGLFDTTTVEGFDAEVYRLTLPPSVPLGNYQVAIRLYKQSGGLGNATSTISLTVVN